jgi:hypothetical protein
VYAEQTVLFGEDRREKESGDCSNVLFDALVVCFHYPVPHKTNAQCDEWAPPCWPQATGLFLDRAFGCLMCIYTVFTHMLFWKHSSCSLQFAGVLILFSL